MIINLLFAFFFCVYITDVVAITSFSTLKDRPELFELTDEEVAVFNIQLSDKDYDLLNERAKVIGITTPRGKMSYYIDQFVEEFPMILSDFFYRNFTKIYPEVDCKKIFPDLNIQDNGYPLLDYNKVFSGIDLNPHHYAYFDFSSGQFFSELLRSCTTFDYNGILNNIFDLNEKYHKDFFYEPRSWLLQFEVQNRLDTLYKNTTYRYNQELQLRYGEPKEFDTKDAILKVNLGGVEKTFDKVTFSLAGEYSRHLVKPGYNIKIRGGEDLYGRSRLKLRSDYGEPTFLRTKLTSDIHSELGLRCILSNYAVLYINDEYMGLFILTDAYKRSWVEYVYGEKETTNLFKCQPGSYFNDHNLRTCVNEIDQFNIANTIEFGDFLDFVLKAKTSEEIEKVFDVEHFLYEMAIEYLLGSWDNLQLGHNYYLYKQPNGKWIYLSYDFDHTFGNNLDRVYVGQFFDDVPEHLDYIDRDYPNYSFEKWINESHMIDVLIMKDEERFNKILCNVVEKVFNPRVLFDRINELKAFIRPYVEKEYIPDENGNLPGRINPLGYNPYTFEHWEANSEFTTVETLQYSAYGIKYWILSKYRSVCESYKDILKCDPVFLSDNYMYMVDTTVEFKGYFPKTESPNTPNPDNQSIHCMAEIISYPCCALDNTKVYATDEYGDWGYDFKTSTWCGITPYVKIEHCKAQAQGYSCCSGCEVVYYDDDGQWGIENDSWCGIPDDCSNKH